jgi:hypothetical protein
MLVPRIKKVVESNNVYMERVLPNPGHIHAKIGDEVKPFDHIGSCSISHSLMKFPKKFKPSKKKSDKQYVPFGSKLGSVDKETITAPFNGHLFKDTDSGKYLFKEIESKYSLLAGVWGNIDKISEGHSVLIKTQLMDMQLVASTKKYFTGELIVFPNPWHTLEKYYLTEFVAGAGGKIIYVGNTVDVELLVEAQRLGVGGILAGSCNKETFTFAKSRDINLGIFTGFGMIDTPSEVFDYLKTVSNRFVIFQGEKNLLRVPIPEPTEKSKKTSVENVLVELEKDMRVFLLEKNYFGQVASVDNVGESSIFVKLPKAKNPVEIHLPNFLALG